MFELQVLLGSVVVPALVAAVAALLATRPAVARRPWAAETLLGLGWVAALWAALGVRVGWIGWPQEIWHQVAWVLPPAALALGLIRGGCCAAGRAAVAPASAASVPDAGSGTEVSAGPDCAGSPVADGDRAAADRSAARWLLIASIVTLAAWGAVPHGSAWQDLHAQQGAWLAAIALATFWGGFALLPLTPPRLSGWGLWLLIPLLVAAAAVTGQAYAQLGEWVVAGAAGLTAILVVLRFTSTSPPASTLGLLVTFFLAATVASGWYYSFDLLPLPLWIFALLLAAPALLGGLDRAVVCCCGGSLRLGRGRLAALIIASCLLAAVVMAVALTAEPEW